MILQLSTHFARKAVPLQSKRRKMKKKLCALRGLCVKLIIQSRWLILFSRKERRER